MFQHLVHESFRCFSDGLMKGKWFYLVGLGCEYGNAPERQDLRGIVSARLSCLGCQDFRHLRQY